MNNRYEQMYRATTLYYIENETMDAIAKQLGTSRPTVSRLLKMARDSGLVRISISDHVYDGSKVVNYIAEQFDVNVHLVPIRSALSGSARLTQVARRAASLIADTTQTDEYIGVAWGTTLSAVAAELPKVPIPGSVVVQMNGSSNPESSGIPYTGSILQAFGKKFGSEVVFFPVPAFFDHVETKRMLWKERSVKRVLELREQLNVAIFGVGAFNGAIPSHVYSAGYFTPHELAHLQGDGVVGDICTVLIREDGTWQDIEANQRATGLTPTEMQRIKHRICVVADPKRAQPVLGALRAGVVTDLVIDDVSAQALAKRLKI